MYILQCPAQAGPYPVGPRSPDTPLAPANVWERDATRVCDPAAPSWFRPLGRVGTCAQGDVGVNI